EYPAQPLTYPFKIKIPGSNAPVNEEIPEGKWGTLYKAAKLLSPNTGAMAKKPRWYLTARLDVKGFDVTKRVQVNIA
ncbi:hypothetical protein KY320_01005, partial [Candidatus Woesearchaeota archaeon]|nr:hypothetical protein [Candidatus Woesearchaeota archaeon]